MKKNRLSSFVLCNGPNGGKKLIWKSLDGKKTEVRKDGEKEEVIATKIKIIAEIMVFYDNEEIIKIITRYMCERVEMLMKKKKGVARCVLISFYITN